MVAMIRHRDRFGEALRLIINATRPDRVHVAPVIFLLRMDQRVAVTFRGRCKNERGLFVLGQAERVMGAERAHFQGRNRQLKIIDRAGRRREMKDVIDFLLQQENEIGDVVLDKLVIFVAGQMPDVCRVAGDKIVDRDDAMTFPQQPIGQMRP